MYDLLHQRYIFKPSLTISRLYGFDGAKHSFLNFLIEDEARPAGVKIPELTCIPAGDYMVKLTMSSRFKRILPIIYNTEELNGEYYVIVDGKHIWRGVRFHPGNTEVETEGCPLPGMKHDGKRTYDSRVAMNDVLMPFIEGHPAYKSQGFVRLRIINDQDGGLL